MVAVAHVSVDNVNNFISLTARQLTYVRLFSDSDDGICILVWSYGISMKSVKI